MWPLLGQWPAAVAAATGATLDTNVQDVLRVLNIRDSRPGPHIDLDVPDIAENGALVPVEVSAASAGINRIVLIAEGNPFPLLADVRFENGALPWMELRIKLAGSTHVEVYALDGGQWYQTRRFVRVIAGGCGQ